MTQEQYKASIRNAALKEAANLIKNSAACRSPESYAQDIMALIDSGGPTELEEENKLLKTENARLDAGWTLCITALADAVSELQRIQGWTSCKDSMPLAGQIIVKRWINGNVWAGRYAGTSKDSGFDSWVLLEE